METITVSVQEIFNLMVAVCAAIITVSGGITVIVKTVHQIHKPEEMQDQRIEGLEEEIKTIKARLEQGNNHFEQDGERIKAIEDSNAVTQRAILALLSHTINGNDVESLKRAKNDLEEYLTEHKK